MQKSLLILILATGLAGCAHHRTSVTDNAGGASNAGEIETLMDPTVTSGSLEAALQTFSHGPPPVSLRSLRPIYSAAQALPQVEKLSRRPVVAMTEYKDWFWYATDLAPTGDPHGTGSFVSGYAVQKGGFLAWKF